MTFLRKALISSAGLAVLGSMGYLVYSAYAVQGQGTLAQAPLNIQANIQPAFVMTVDDSGSMTFETLFPARDGQGCYSSGSFFSAPGELRTSGTCAYHHLIPHSGSRYRIGTTRYAIPPLDLFGFARSPDYNPQYFAPDVDYDPWVNQDGSTFPNASLTAARVDPRDTSPTVNLFATREEGGSAVLHFRALTGMVIPANTRYYKSANCGGLLGNTGQWVSRNSDQTLTANCEIGISYYPATFYLPTATSAPVGFDTTKRSTVVNGCGTGCDLYKYEIRSENYSLAGAYAAAAQNFANWFTYYGNRNRAMVSGMTQSLLDINNMRVGYFRINQNASFDNPIGSATERVTMRDMAVGADRTALYSDLLALPASGGTPNRQAVNAANLQFTRTDAGAPVKLACQKNAVMLFTDGYSNGDGPTVGNNDSGMGAPFADGNSNTLADIATRYYLNTNGSVGAGGTTLLPLANEKVPVPAACSLANPDPKLDCQSNQHVNFYGITLGARGELYVPNASGVYPDPYLTPAVYNNWPARENDNPSTVDDIWHAAVNTRGEFINARTPRDITEAMRRILASVGGGETPSGTIALTGSRVGTGSLSVVPTYTSANNGTDWFSTLTAQTVSADPITGALQYTSAWEAAAQLPAAGSRKILVGKTTTGVVPTVGTFNSTTVSLNDLCNDALSRCVGTGAGRNAISGAGLGLEITLDNAINYLRGDQALETATKPLRKRTNRLGDIVNSSPLVSSPINDYGYRSLQGATAGTYNPYNYDAYLTAKKTRRPMVYAGANDGMFHAFDGVTGVEQFAYVPATSLGHMGNLLFPYKAADKNDQVFSHRYYVDGPVTVSDAYYGGTWKTVVVGTAGAGGRGVFALNVSDPASFAASSVLWEVNDRVSTTAIKNNIGHVLGKPVIVPVKIGTVVQWKAIFGNGYDSINKTASLFVVDIATGAVTTIGASEASQPGPNGLGNIIVLDRFVGSTTSAGSDGYADTVYAGDQNGAVWKFDLRSSSPAALTVPFFVSTDSGGARQAIIGGFEAAAGPGAGVILYFGTGSFSFVNDASDKQVQSLYAVLDQGVAVDRSQLHQQTVVSDALGVRTTSVTPIPAGKKGWYIDLSVGGVASGERFVGNPRLESGVIFFPTFDPNTTDSCATGGTNRLYGLSALSGAAALSAVRVGSPTGTQPGSGTGALSLNTTGSSPVKDVAVWVAPRLGPLASTATAAEVAAALESRCSMVIQVAGADPVYIPRPCGRQSWRQVR